jgi:hypothetical protein
MLNYAYAVLKCQVRIVTDMLLDEPINRALGRRQPGLKAVLAHLRIMARTMPEALSEDQIDTPCLVLEYLLDEKKLPQHENRSDPGQLTVPITIDERPEHRVIATQLAFRLRAELERRDADIPQALADWERVGQEDPLPEVRRAWG